MPTAEGLWQADLADLLAYLADLADLADLLADHLDDLRRALHVRLAAA